MNNNTSDSTLSPARRYSNVTINYWTDSNHCVGKLHNINLSLVDAWCAEGRVWSYHLA